MLRRTLSLFLSFVLLLWSVPGYGQCSSGSCPLPTYPSAPRSPSYGNSAPQAPNVAISAELKEKITLASVKVKGEISDRLSGYGSGTLFRWSYSGDDGTPRDSVGVLTAGHVVEDARQVLVIHPTLGPIPCDVLVYNTDVDYAILEPRERQEELFAYAVTYYSGALMKPGDGVIIAGYASNSTVSVRSGRFISYTTARGGRIFGNRSIFYEGDINEFRFLQGVRAMLGFRSQRGLNAPNWMKIVGVARSGDSGGGLFTTDGRLIGNIWGSDMQNEVMGAWFSPAAYELVEKVCVFSWGRKRNPDNKPGTNPGTNPGTAPDTNPTPGVPDSGSVTPPDKPKPEEPKPEAPKPEVKPVPVNPWDKLWEFLKPTVYVVIFYLCFVLTFGLVYLLSLRR